VSGTSLWVVNEGGNSLTELNASNGSFIQVVNAPADMFYNPNAIAVSGSDIWVTSDGVNSIDFVSTPEELVTELNASDGSLVRVINAPADGFSPWAIAVSGAHVWVANTVMTGSGSSGKLMGTFTELNASDGSLVRVINTPGVNIQGGMVTNGSDLLVSAVNMNNATNQSYNSVYEYNMLSGSLVHVVHPETSTTFGFQVQAGLAISGSHLWVAEYVNGQVTEFSVPKLSVVQVIK
jgi:hypothetical protein